MSEENELNTNEPSADPTTDDYDETLALHGGTNDACDYNTVNNTVYGSAHSATSTVGADHTPQVPSEEKSTILPFVKVDSEGRSSVLKEYAGLQKSDLEPYMTDSFWVRMRWTLAILSGFIWLLMLAAAVAIIIGAPKCAPRPLMDWWQRAVIYQIYVPSFEDSNSDGIGDLSGISKRLPYLENLGVTTLWLSSLFAVFDGSHQDNAIIDHKDINPKYGTMIDFDNLILALHQQGMKVIVDFVPNHTSRYHKWFQESRKQGGQEYDNYYIWGSGRVDGEPPNNWLSTSGGSAWTFDEDRSQYYYHHASSDLPDLNLENPVVLHELDDILRFWLARGVDGFYVQSSEYLTESVNLTLNEPESHVQAAQSDYRSLNHTLTTFQAKSHHLIHRWRHLLDDFSQNNGKFRSQFFPRVLITGLSGGTVEQISEFSVISNDTGTKGAHLTTNLALLQFNGSCHAVCMYNLAKDWSDRVQTTRIWSNWQLGNQMTSRVATRAGDPRYVNALNMLLLTLPGTPFTYYGEEIGMRDYKTGDVIQPTENWNIGQYPQRALMQWTDKLPPVPSAVNSTVTTPPVADDDYLKGHNVKTQLAHGSGLTNLDVYKELAKLRRAPSFEFGEFNPGVEDNIFFYVRNASHFPGFLVAINLGPRSSTVDFRAAPPNAKLIPPLATIAATTGHFEGVGRQEDYAVGTSVKLNNVHLRPTEGVVFRWEADAVIDVDVL